MTPPVTVAVVSWNTRDLLARCLGSLAADAEAGRADVWVFDNASSDESPEMVAREFPWVSLIASSENRGFGPAVNEIARQTGGEWLAPANADVEVARGALARLLAAGESDRRAAIVAPRLVLPDGSTQHSVHSFPTVTLSVAFTLRLQALSPALGDRLCLDGYWDASRPRYVDWAHGAFLLVRRAAFDGVGGFDPEQWMYAEDLDLAWRLSAAGWRTRYEPDAAVRHEVSAATKKAFAGERAARHMAATYAWMLRRRGRVVTRLFAAVNVAGAAARWSLLAPLAKVRPERWAEACARARAYAGHHSLGLRGRGTVLDSARAGDASRSEAADLSLR